MTLPRLPELLLVAVLAVIGYGLLRLIKGRNG
jgi:hypothetical protein